MAIPATHAEVEQIYQSAELRECRSVCLMACQSGEGVTALTMALCERYLLAGYRTALVDLNLFHPSFQPAVINENQTEWLQHTKSLRCFTGITLPQETANQLVYKRPDFLRKAMESWLTQYDRVVVDTSPLLNINRNNIPAQSVAGMCDGAVLVVLAGYTTSSRIDAAMELLKQANIELMGTVLNCRDKPTLASEICREINRIPLIPERWKESFKTKVLKNTYLNTAL